MRDQYIQVKVSEEEKRQIKELAAKRGLSVSAYIRQVALYLAKG